MTPVERLAVAVRAAAHAAEAELHDRDWVAEWVASAGLYTDHRDLYGGWAPAAFPPGTAGAWQHPEELAGLLVHLAGRGVRTALEVGHFRGWTATLCAAYLGRFGLERYVGHDVTDWGPPAGLVPGLEFRYGARPAGRWDFVLIDAEHSYAGARDDWVNYRTRSRLVAFHDVNDAAVRDTAGYDGGVWRLWREVRAAAPDSCHEFLRPDGVEAFGIGLVAVAG